MISRHDFIYYVLSNTAVLSPLFCGGITVNVYYILRQASNHRHGNTESLLRARALLVTFRRSQRASRRSPFRARLCIAWRSEISEFLTTPNYSSYFVNISVAIRPTSWRRDTVIDHRRGNESYSGSERDKFSVASPASVTREVAGHRRLLGHRGPGPNDSAG